MKSWVFLFVFCLSVSVVFAQQATMYVEGNTLKDKCGNAVVLHGVNYPVLDDWAFPASSEVSTEIEKSGANAVRIQWYIDYGQPARPAYTLANLDTVISRVARLDMIPIVELHDFTCQAGMSDLADEIVPWFTQNDVLQLIEKHKAYLIINLANEYGHVNWANNVGTAQTQFQSAYSNTVLALRNAGINVPLMIDAPDCGTSSNRLLDVAGNILNADPLENILFSVHTYWYAYAQNDSIAMRNYIQQMASSEYCFVLGEVANYQDDGSYCTYALDYTAILHSSKDLGIGWLIWAWYKDGCAARQITTAGNYSSLTAFGNTVINHPSFGLKNVAERSPYLLNGECDPSGIENHLVQAVHVYPNPAQHSLTWTGLNESAKQVTLTDMTGRIIFHLSSVSTNTILLPSDIVSGCYILNINGNFVSHIIINR